MCVLVVLCEKFTWLYFWPSIGFGDGAYRVVHFGGVQLEVHRSGILAVLPIRANCMALWGQYHIIL